MRHFSDIERMVFVSDTHGLIRAVLERELEGAGLILHAGDVGSPAVLTWLGKFAPTVAVRGNVDGAGLKLPETEVVSVNGQWIYVLHQLERLDLAPAAAGFRMVISGHSHQASVRQKDGVWFCNPGSIGPRRFRLPITFLDFTVGPETWAGTLKEIVAAGSPESERVERREAFLVGLGG